MKNTFFSIIAAVAVLLACSSPENPQVKRQEDLPVHKDTVNVADQINTNNDSLNNYLAENPNDVDALAFRAQRYMEQKNLKYAEADAAEAMRLDSLNPNALLVWGDVNYLRNNTRESRDAWTRCIQQDAENVDCRLKLAELYNIVQEYRKSTELVNEVLEIDENQPVAYFIKGMNVRDMSGDTASAMQYFQKAIDLDNDYVAALDMMGVLMSARKDPLALAYFDRVLEINPNHYSSYYNKGMFYLNTQDWNNAIKAFTKCTQLNPKDTEALFNLGYIHLQLNINDVARDYFSQAIEIKQFNPRALYGRAYAFERLGDIRNAEKDYRAALAYNPDHTPSKIGLERILKMKNEGN